MSAVRNVRKGLMHSDLYKEISQGSSPIIKGQENILKYPEFGSSDKVIEFFQSLSHKYITRDILERCLEDNGFRIFVGKELLNSNIDLGLDNSDMLSDYGLIVKGYGDSDNLGFIGVIGPKRMDYHSILPILDYTAEELNKVMKKNID